MAPPLSVGARHWAGWTGPAPARPPPVETPLSAAPLPPLPPTWGTSRCLIRQGEEAQEPPLPISSALLFFHIQFFSCAKAYGGCLSVPRILLFFFFFLSLQTPLKPAEKLTEIQRVRGGARGGRQKDHPLSSWALSTRHLGRRRSCCCHCCRRTIPGLLSPPDPQHSVTPFAASSGAPQAPVCPPLPGTAEGRGEKLLRL